MISHLVSAKNKLKSTTSDESAVTTVTNYKVIGSSGWKAIISLHMEDVLFRFRFIIYRVLRAVSRISKDVSSTNSRP